MKFLKIANENFGNDNINDFQSPRKLTKIVFSNMQLKKYVNQYLKSSKLEIWDNRPNNLLQNQKTLNLIIMMIFCKGEQVESKSQYSGKLSYL